MKKKCELCGAVARMYCESDQASLCWDCDHKVHGANFLVAKHTRCLLCSACQSPTPWKAAGPRLGPTITACDSCVSLQNGGGGISTSGHNLSENRSRETSGHDYDEHPDDGGAESYDDDEEDDDDDEYSDDDDDDDEEEEGENQVVPWAEAAALQPTMVSSSSSVSSGGGEAFPRHNVGSLGTKRTRGNSDLLYSDEETGCSLKRSSRDENSETAPRSTATINSIMRLHSEKSLDGDDLVYTSRERDHHSR